MTFASFNCPRGWFFGLLLAILSTVAACGGLAGEPGIVATISPATPAPTEVGYPLTAPDVAAGAQIYAQRCTRCHGESGRGDGELIGDGQDQIAQAPADFTDPATTAAKTPLAWFNIITNGRIDNFMPPWRDTLTEQQRWDVAMYIYTLHYTADALAQGKSLLEQNGIAADSLPTSAELVNLTDSDLLTKFAEGSNALNNLEDTQKQAVASYLRTLTLTNADTIGQSLVQPAATIEPATTPESGAVTGTVSGIVTNATAGGVVPPDLKATLHILDDQFNDDPRDANAAPDGQFSFADIPLQADHNYIVTVEYQGRTFASDFLPADPAVGKLDLPVKIYEITSDPAVITIAGWVSQVTPVDKVLQIAQVVSLVNTSDKAYSRDLLPNDDRYASLEFKLPPGAQVLSITPDDSRYVVSSDSSAVIDTAPVIPGEQHIVQFIYSVPYSGSLQIEQPLSYAVQGPVRLLLSSDAITVTSEQLVPLGPQTIRDQSYAGYGASLTLGIGDVLRYRIEGVTSTSSTATSSPSSPNNILPIILIIIGVSAMVVALVVYLRGTKPVTQPASSDDPKSLIDGLIRQIAELDDSFAAGDVDEDTYHKRRAKLKSRLTELMDEE